MKWIFVIVGLIFGVSLALFVPKVIRLLPLAAQPIQESDVEAYLKSAKAYSLIHSETLDELQSAIIKQASNSSEKASLNSRNLAPLLRMNTRAMTTDEILTAIRELHVLSPEAYNTLNEDRETLLRLFLRIKTDQVKLLQKLPPPNATTCFHVLHERVTKRQADQSLENLGAGFDWVALETVLDLNGDEIDDAIVDDGMDGGIDAVYIVDQDVYIATFNYASTFDNSSKARTDTGYAQLLPVQVPKVRRPRVGTFLSLVVGLELQAAVPFQPLQLH